MHYYVYVLFSLKGKKFYTGYTNNLKNRLKEHQNGKVFSTKNRLPLILIYFEGCLNQQDATRREKYLKSGNGKIYLRNRMAEYFNKNNPTG
ncbi:MAG: GIY-YIG nuclease family protein [Sphingobacteriales bacterium]|nr:GIY-YIG nuclease family protein [Sphingobacteriales bacterium]